MATKTPEERTESVLERWSSLDLSAEQDGKLREIVLARETEIQGVRERVPGKEQKEARKEQIEEVQKNYRPQINALFTKDQASKLKQLREQWKALKAGPA